MLAETRFFTLANILLHAIATQRDASESLTLFDLAHEIVPVTIGQSEVADHEIERLVVGNFERGVHIRGGLNVVAEVLDEPRQAAQKGGMVVDQQDAQGRTILLLLASLPSPAARTAGTFGGD